MLLLHDMVGSQEIEFSFLAIPTDSMSLAVDKWSLDVA